MGAEGLGSFACCLPPALLVYYTHMSPLTWIIIIVVTFGLLATMIFMSTYFKEDKVWRWLFSLLFTVVLLVVFGGAYFAGAQGWWWMSILFATACFITIYSVLVPD